MSEIDELRALESSWISKISKEFRGVILSLSGGPDSTALFHLILEMTKRKKNFRLAVFHMNFGLRDKHSDEDEQFCRELAEGAQVVFHSFRVSPPEAANTLKSGGVQAWARLQRLAVCDDFAKAGWAIALAHTQDDLAENVLLRMARGSAPASVAGMREWDGAYWRPLLRTRKKSLISWLEARSLTWREDESNRGRAYARNVIRHDVLPVLESLWPGATQRIALFGEDCQSLLSPSFPDVLSNDSGEIELNLELFRRNPPAEARQYLAFALKKLHATDQEGRFLVPQLSREWLDAALQAIASVESDSRWSRDLPGGGRLNVTKGRVWIDAAPLSRQKVDGPTLLDG